MVQYQDNQSLMNVLIFGRAGTTLTRPMNYLRVFSIPLTVILAIAGCRASNSIDNSAEVKSGPVSEALNQYMDFWAKQDDAIPCDQSDTSCNKEFPLEVAENQFGLVSSSVDAPSPDLAANIDISKDVTKLLNKTFVDGLNGFNCSATDEVIPTPYFSGIQGQDKIILFVSADSTTANFYTGNVAPSIDDKNALIRHWKLFHYYNQPKINPPNPSFTRTNLGTYTDTLFRESRLTNRYTKRDAKGNVTLFGDETEARLLGIWAVADGNKFHTHSPLFAGSNAPEDARDFPLFFRDTINNPGWKKFMYNAAWNVGVAMKCGKSIMMHSGGGSVGGFLVRLLAEKTELEIPKWLPDGKIILIGFEAVLTEGAYKAFNKLPSLGGRVIMENHVVGQKERDFTGSDTWTDTIDPELRTAGFVPLKTHAAVGSTTSFWNPLQGGHGGVGFYPLRYGRMPNYLFPKPNQGWPK